MIFECNLKKDLNTVCIQSTFYDQAVEFIQLLLVDAKTTEDDQIHMLASMFQDAWDKGREKGITITKERVVKNLFK